MKIEAKRAFIISDTHLGARSNSVEWLEIMTNWFYEDFIPKVKERYQPGDILIHCGDVFDNRQSVNLLVLHEGIRLFEQLSKIFQDGIYVIAGNHDVLRKTTNEVSSLDCLKYIPGINIIKEPVVAELGETRALFMPWRTNEAAELKCLEDHKIKNLHYLFCHTNIRNLKFDNGRDVEEGIELSNIVNFRRVYSGHIHWGQRRGNVTMVGNPYQMTRSDATNPKGWYILDINEGSEEFIENHYSPKFIRVYLNKFLDKSVDELKRICSNNRVDLYVPSMFLLKYQINPIIDILSEITKKLEVIPFDDESSSEYDEINDLENTSFDIYGLCEKFVRRLSTLDDSTKDRIMLKINNLHTSAVKEIHE